MPDVTWQEEAPPELVALMWAGDMDKLQELYPCDCCCKDHTWARCMARHYNGCRSGLRFGVSEPVEDEVQAEGSRP